jgi:hypothetical protein
LSTDDVDWSPAVTSALVVHVPGFRTRLMVQANPLANASNMLTVTLEPDCNMTAGSNVTVRGLLGTQTADSSELAVTS